ncbi:MAG: HAMP domain-containing histidine kinase [Candidatus Obscuribacter sp.]|jgi:signal transduction histidine kinase|nr:HAMP domain-containing histidine kinase [Candidatus Obscuribacter sp.]
MNTSKLQLTREMTPVSKIFSVAMSTLSGAAEQQNVSLESVYVPDRAVYVDEVRLVQVLVDLITNAIKVSPKPGVVQVSAQGEDGCMRFIVCDGGHGIEPGRREAIFEGVRQFDTLAAQGASGSLPSLAVCKAIVESHGGKIGVDSEPGKGSAFWFTVPLTD